LYDRREQWFVFAYYQRHEKETGHVVFVYYRLMHEQPLCVKCITINNVVTIVAELVGYIRSKGLHDRQFKEVLSDIESDNGDELYHTYLRRLI
jgi:hypothetical protein